MISLNDQSALMLKSREGIGEIVSRLQYGTVIVTALTIPGILVVLIILGASVTHLVGAGLALAMYAIIVVGDAWWNSGRVVIRRQYAPSVYWFDCGGKLANVVDPVVEIRNYSGKKDEYPRCVFLVRGSDEEPWEFLRLSCIYRESDCEWISEFFRENEIEFSVSDSDS